MNRPTRTHPSLRAPVATFIAGLLALIPMTMASAWFGVPRIVLAGYCAALVGFVVTQLASWRSWCKWTASPPSPGAGR